MSQQSCAHGRLNMHLRMGGRRVGVAHHIIVTVNEQRPNVVPPLWRVHGSNVGRKSGYLEAFSVFLSSFNQIAGYGISASPKFSTSSLPVIYCITRLSVKQLI
jgi:hypothetical protein